MIDTDDPILSTKEGWSQFVEHEDAPAPERLSPARLAALSKGAREDYDDRRSYYHANLGPLETPQLRAVHTQLDELLYTNKHSNEKAKGILAVDGNAGLGKTTMMFAYGRKFHRDQIAKFGPYTDNGDERWPVCRIGLGGNPTVLDFTKTLLGFYAHPGESGNSREFTRQTLQLVVRCKTRLLIVDDFHFIKPRFKNGMDVSNQLKAIANDFPLTIVVIGVGLTRRGVFSENTTTSDQELAQLLRRTTVLSVTGFSASTEEQRRQWYAMLTAIESRLVLAKKRPGMLTGSLSDYLFYRTSGNILSLMTLIQRGCTRAIGTGQERLTRTLLEKVPLDLAADQARKNLEAEFRAGRKTTKCLPIGA